MRINGRLPPTETEIEIDQEIEGMEQLKKLVCRTLGLKNAASLRLFTEDGVELFGDDFFFMNNDDTLYVSVSGEDFQYSQLLSIYKQTKLLGQGGFGKVYQAEHERTGAFAAIKYINVSDAAGRANLIDDIFMESKTLRMLKHKNII